MHDEGRKSDMKAKSKMGSAQEMRPSTETAAVDSYSGRRDVLKKTKIGAMGKIQMFALKIAHWFFESGALKDAKRRLMEADSRIKLTKMKSSKMASR